MPQNQRFQSPVLPAQSGKLLSGSLFTKGDVKVYYAPDQPFENGDGNQTNQIMALPTQPNFWTWNTVSTRYQSPSDWISAGFPLVFPQVALISLCFNPEWMQVSGSPFPSGDGYIINFGTPPWPATIDPYWQGTSTLFPPSVKAVNNMYYREWSRLTPIVASVATTINRLRANTYVADTHLQNVIQPPTPALMPLAPTNGSPCFSPDFHHIEGTVTCMLAPPESTKNWLGVDLLHIYIGSACHDFIDRTLGSGIQGRTSLLDTASYQNSLTRFKSTYSSFRRYSTWIYGCSNIDWGASDSGIDPVVRVIDAEHIAPGQAISQAVWESENVPSYTAMDAASDSVLQSLALNNQGYGFSFQGTSNLITESYLLNRIAQYFKFDPNTGADLAGA